jgi:hypothetical protein
MCVYACVDMCVCKKHVNYCVGARPTLCVCLHENMCIDLCVYACVDMCLYIKTWNTLVVERN